MMNKKPPQIIYKRGKAKLHSREEILETVNKAVEVMHLKERPAALIRYYCSCKTGFRPALKTIEQATGIPQNKISQIRQILVQIGMIHYESWNDWIMIDLERIALYSTLDPDLTGRNRNHWTIDPQPEEDYRLIDDPQLKKELQNAPEALYQDPPWNGYIPDSVRWRYYNEYRSHATKEDQMMMSDFKAMMRFFQAMEEVKHNENSQRSSEPG